MIMEITTSDKTIVNEHQNNELKCNNNTTKDNFWRTTKWAQEATYEAKL